MGRLRDDRVVTSLPAGGGSEDLAAVLTSGLVLVCEGCGDEAEAVLECECCGEQLCEECWGDGDPFCESCAGGELGPRERGRPVEIMRLRDGYR